MRRKLEVQQPESHATAFLTRKAAGDPDRKSDQSIRGVSLIELVIVLTITILISAVALPQMVEQRRLMRSAAATREILTQMRFARQTAMSKRRAYTFQYDDSTKVCKVIGPIPPGTAALVDVLYPNNTGSSVVTIPLATGGLLTGEIRYGIPTTSTGLPAGSTALPTGALADGVSKTDLVNSKLNITFQPDGSVINANGDPVDRAMFIFNNKAAKGSASAISVLGSSGRVKVWRYSVNGNQYAE